MLSVLAICLSAAQADSGVRLEWQRSSLGPEWVAVRDADQAEIWRIGARDYVFARPATNQNRTHFVIPVPAVDLICIDSTGRILWRLDTLEFPEPNAIVVTDRWVLVGRGTGTTSALSKPGSDREYRVECRDLLTGALSWSKPTSLFGVPLCSIRQDLVLTATFGEGDHKELQLWDMNGRCLAGVWQVSSAAWESIYSAVNERARDSDLQLVVSARVEASGTLLLTLEWLSNRGQFRSAERFRIQRLR